MGRCAFNNLLPMKYTTSLLIAGLMFVPFVCSAQILTQAQRETILQEIASLEQQLISILSQQTGSAPVATTTPPVDNQAVIDNLNSQISAYEVDIQSKKADTRLGGCTEEFGNGQLPNKMNQKDWDNCTTWQSDDTSDESADQTQINADEVQIIKLGGSVTNVTGSVPATNWCSTIYWQQHFCESYSG